MGHGDDAASNARNAVRSRREAATVQNYPPPFPDASGPRQAVVCPHCGVTLAVTSFQTGSVVTCMNCAGALHVPAAPPVQGLLAAGYPPPGSNGGGYGYAPAPTVRDFASKKVAAGICGIVFGGLGIHKFILGFNTAGAIMLSVWLACTFTGMCLFVPLVGTIALNIIGLVEGIIYLTKSDDEFYQLYAVQRKEWF